MSVSRRWPAGTGRAFHLFVTRGSSFESGLLVQTQTLVVGAELP